MMIHFLTTASDAVDPPAIARAFFRLEKSAMARIDATQAGGTNVLAFLDMLAWSEGTSIIDGSTGGQLFRVDALEVYSISLVPEPGSTAMFVGGLGVLGWAAWRRRARPALARGMGRH